MSEELDLIESNALKSERKNGYLVVVDYDMNPLNPRTEWDNIAKILCWHRRYAIGDRHEYGTPDDAMRSLYKEYGDDGVEIVPLYMYDHSGIRLSTAPFGDPWDSGQIGFVAVTKEDLVRFGTIRKDAGEDWREKAREVAEGEVKVLDAYASGDVYGYRVFNADAEETDSCWGYYGEPEYALREGLSCVPDKEA